MKINTFEKFYLEANGIAKLNWGNEEAKGEIFMEQGNSTVTRESFWCGT